MGLIKCNAIERKFNYIIFRATTRQNLKFKPKRLHEIVGIY